MGWAIGGILLGLAIFGFLRARAVVAETWGFHPSRSIVGVIAIAAAILFVVAFARSVVGGIVAGAILGVALYGSWRLRRT